MATVSDITVTPLSGLNHIDALLDKGPDWNFLPNAGSNIIQYTFSISSGNEAGKTGQEAFTVAQQAAARTIFSYLQQETGIQFVETTNGGGAQIHLANINLDGSNVTGLCSWAANYSYTANNTLADYSANAYVYLDNVEFRSENHNLAVGTQGYQTLLHELGHALGLKHPFESGGNPNDVLSAAEDNTSNTLMSYTHIGAPKSTFSPYDIAALNWLYGRDGLGGALGIGSSTNGRYITGTNKNETLTGTQFNDTFQGNGGNTMIIGGSGTDTAIFNGNRNTFSFSNLSDGSLAVSGAAGITTLQSVEILQFADMTMASADVAVTATPSAPVVAVTQNGAQFARGNVPQFNGSAEANATVRLYIGDKLIATAKADANGLWSTKSELAFADGLNYLVTGTATNAAGVTSAPSAGALFHVDATAPSVPTLAVALDANANRPLFSGTGEPGSTIDLWRDGDFTKIDSVTVGADGKWSISSSPLPNGTYDVIVTSTDLAGNSTSGAQKVPMTISNSNYISGTGGADTITMTAGSKAVDGGNGIDTVVYSGARDSYKVQKEVWGYSVTSASGQVDGLFNVERIKFADGWKAIDTMSAQIFRLYEAVLDRTAEDAGLGYWISSMEKGTTLHEVAADFLKQPEFVSLYGSNPTDQEFIYKLYENVLDREPDTGGLLYWSQMIGQIGRAQILIDFAESPENQALVIDKVGQGLDYIPWAG